MASRIIDANDESVTFEVIAQKYKQGRFTLSAPVLRRLGLERNERVRLQVCSLDDNQRSAGV